MGARQMSVIARNTSTGALYVLWYDNSIRGFRVGKVLDGSSPTNGQSCVIWYLAD